MLGKIPIDISKVSPGDIDREILRSAMIAELDAVNLYEQMASMADNDDVRAVLLDVAKEEKTHVGEFEALLVRLDGEQAEELRAGEEEVVEMTNL